MEEKGDSANVEVFLPSGTTDKKPKEESVPPTKPFLFPSNQVDTISKSNRARRRWKLLKNVGMAVRRRTSLTKNEKEFLSKLKKTRMSIRLSASALSKLEEGEDSELEDVAADETTSKLQLRKKELRKAISIKAASLTETEREFLEHIVADEHEITEEEINQVQKVLEGDPFLNEKNADKDRQESEQQANEEDTDENKQGKETEKSKRKSSQGSFRKEVWMEYNSIAKDSFPEETKEQDSINQASDISNIDSAGCCAVDDNPVLAFICHLFPKLEENAGEEVRDKDTIAEEKKDDKGEGKLKAKEEFIEYSILATSVDDTDCSPHVLSPPIMHALRAHLPFAIQEDNFWLKYSMRRDGASIRSLLKQIRNSSRVVLAIETFDGDVFGCFTSTQWRPKGRTFYGSGEAFLWRLKKSRFTPCKTVRDQVVLEREIEVFKWSGQNYNVQSLANMESQLIVGGGGPDDDPASASNRDDCGSGIIISSDMEHGTSDTCLTFKSPSLPTKQSKEGANNNIFDIANIEVWTMTPVESLHEAEQLELGRQFIFDHMQQ